MLLSFFGEDCDVRGLTEQDQLAFTRKRLDQNLLAGVRRPREKNPKRPVAGWERYQETRRILQELIANAKAELSRLKWLKLDLALTLGNWAQIRGYSSVEVGRHRFLSEHDSVACGD